MPQTGLTPSEKFVADLCQKSFLKLWTHPNPKGKKGKELCDCLIVCGEHIVIISVKENEYRDTGNETGWKRWIKSAIDKSVSQLRGAERRLETISVVERHDGRIVNLPVLGSRKYHRIAVALGGRGEVPIQYGDFGHGFVHVVDEYSVEAMFATLDTITDFVDFLSASEEFVRNGPLSVFAGGGIEDLIALYILRGRSFGIETSEQQADIHILHNDLWQGLIESEGYKKMKEDLSDSYIWDRLVDRYSEDLLTGGMFDMHSKEVTDNQLALVAMALQPRECRAVLAKAFIEFLEKPELKSAARMVRGYNNCAFVFTMGPSEDREFRARELALRCLVVRGRLPNTQTVIGIATDRPGLTIGHSSDIIYLHIPEWDEENEKAVQGIQEDLAYFKNITWENLRSVNLKLQ